MTNSTGDTNKRIRVEPATSRFRDSSFQQFQLRYTALRGAHHEQEMRVPTIRCAPSNTRSPPATTTRRTVHHHHHHQSQQDPLQRMQHQPQPQPQPKPQQQIPPPPPPPPQHQRPPPPQHPKNPVKKKRRRQSFCIRTREKERIKEHHLTLDVMQLQQEIQRFQAVRDILANRSHMERKVKSDSFMRIVRSYYDTFRYGFLTPFAAKKQLIGKVCTHDQSKFLASIVHHDVCSGRFQGVHVLLDQWARHANFVAFLNLQMVHSEIINLDHFPIVHTLAELHVRFTRMTIKKVFPHLIGQDKIMQKVVGLEIKCPMKIVFCFGAQEQIVRLDFTTDYVMALLRVGMEPLEITQILTNAKISEEGFLGDLPASYRRTPPLQSLQVPTRLAPTSTSEDVIQKVRKFRAKSKANKTKLTQPSQTFRELMQMDCMSTSEDCDNE